MLTSNIIFNLYDAILTNKFIKNELLEWKPVKKNTKNISILKTLVKCLLLHPNVRDTWVSRR